MEKVGRQESSSEEMYKHPDGELMGTDMTRWQLSDQDLADLFAFLKSMPQ